MKCMVKVLSYKVSNLFFPVTSNSKFKVEALSLWDIPCVPAFNMGVDITISDFNHPCEVCKSTNGIIGLPDKYLFVNQLMVL